MSGKIILLLGDEISTQKFISIIGGHMGVISETLYDNDNCEIMKSNVIEQKGFKNAYISLMPSNQNNQIIKQKLDILDIDYIICTIIESGIYNNVKNAYTYATTIISKKIHFFVYTYFDGNYVLRLYNNGNMYFISFYISIAASLDFILTYNNRYHQNYLISPTDVNIANPNRIITDNKNMNDANSNFAKAESCNPLSVSVSDGIPSTEQAFLIELDQLIKIIPEYTIDLSLVLINMRSLRLRSLAKKINCILKDISDINGFSYLVNFDDMSVFITKQLLIEYFKKAHGCEIYNITNDNFTLRW